MNKNRNVTIPALKMHADDLERCANESLSSRIVLGQIDKHERDMEQVRRLRHAMTLRTAAERRAYLGWD